MGQGVGQEAGMAEALLSLRGVKTDIGGRSVQCDLVAAHMDIDGRNQRLERAHDLIVGTEQTRHLH